MGTIEEIIGKEFLQNCGDTLIVLEKTNLRNKKGKGNILYKCQFKKFSFICFKTKTEIIKGEVGNPELEKNKIVGKVFKQNCGDSLIVLRRSEERQIRKDINRLGEYKWEAKFIKYPYKVIVTKGEILKGSILNPLIEKYEFIDKVWPQNCGDSLKIIKKSENKRNDVWDCEFIKYPYKISAYKGNILAGKCLNPQIEINKYTNKIIKQNRGDSILLKRKVGNLWEGEFLEYSNVVKRPLYQFLSGDVVNEKLPWLYRTTLIKYIKENFNSKPTLQELANSLKVSLSTIYLKRREFDLYDLIAYNNLEEDQIKCFVKSIYKGTVQKYCGTSKEKYREIDIYLPELKKGIEYNGSFWHEEGNFNNPYSKEIGYHKEKKDIFAKKGIDILFIWDYEWFEDFPKRKTINEQTKQKIKKFLNI